MMFTIDLAPVGPWARDVIKGQTFYHQQKTKGKSETQKKKDVKKPPPQRIDPDDNAEDAESDFIPSVPALPSSPPPAVPVSSKTTTKERDLDDFNRIRFAYLSMLDGDFDETSDHTFSGGEVRMDIDWLLWEFQTQAALGDLHKLAQRAGALNRRLNDLYAAAKNHIDRVNAHPELENVYTLRFSHVRAMVQKVCKVIDDTMTEFYGQSDSDD
jgi:hypothetical protein